MNTRTSGMLELVSSTAEITGIFAVSATSIRNCNVFLKLPAM
jgi:hypothetical protein